MSNCSCFVGYPTIEEVPGLGGNVQVVFAHVFRCQEPAKLSHNKYTWEFAPTPMGIFNTQEQARLLLEKDQGHIKSCSFTKNSNTS